MAGPGYDGHENYKILSRLELINTANDGSAGGVAPHVPEQVRQLQDDRRKHYQELILLLLLQLISTYQGSPRKDYTVDTQELRYIPGDSAIALHKVIRKNATVIPPFRGKYHYCSTLRRKRSIYFQS